MNECELIHADGAWVLLWQGREYIRLLEATSREDAERQIAEMLFIAQTSPGRLTPDNTAYLSSETPDEHSGREAMPGLSHSNSLSGN